MYFGTMLAFSLSLKGYQVSCLCKNRFILSTFVYYYAIIQIKMKYKIKLYII